MRRFPNLRRNEHGKSAFTSYPMLCFKIGDIVPINIEVELFLVFPGGEYEQAIPGRNMPAYEIVRGICK